MALPKAPTFVRIVPIELDGATDQRADDWAGAFSGLALSCWKYSVLQVTSSRPSKLGQEPGHQAGSPVESDLATLQKC